MKYILLIILCFLSSTGFTQSNNTDNSITAKTSFKGRHCRGTHGLCNMDTSVREADLNTRITYDNTNNTIIISINRTMLSEEELFLVLRGNQENSTSSTQLFYLMEDDFIIPNTITQQLQVGREDVTIHKGLFPLTIVDDTIIISFKLE